LETTNKDDAEKLRYDVVPASFERALALVLAFGAKKYGKNTWQQVKHGSERYYSALRRHLAAWTEGEFTDKESGLPHLYHVAVNALFCDWFDQQKVKESEPKGTVDFDALRDAFFKRHFHSNPLEDIGVDTTRESCEGCPEDIKKNCESPYKEESNEDKEEVKEKGVITVRVKVGNEEAARRVAKVIEETFGTMGIRKNG